MPNIPLSRFHGGYYRICLSTRVPLRHSMSVTCHFKGFETNHRNIFCMQIQRMKVFLTLCSLVHRSVKPSVFFISSGKLLSSLLASCLETLGKMKWSTGSPVDDKGHVCITSLLCQATACSHMLYGFAYTTSQAGSNVITLVWPCSGLISTVSRNS